MILRSLAPWLDVEEDDQQPVSPVLQQIADRLAAHDLLVDFDIGNSVFGWKVYSMLAKDWLDDPVRIVEEIVTQCADDQVAGERD